MLLKSFIEPSSQPEVSPRNATLLFHWLGPLFDSVSRKTPCSPRLPGVTPWHDFLSAAWPCCPKTSLVIDEFSLLITELLVFAEDLSMQSDWIEEMARLKSCVRSKSFVDIMFLTIAPAESRIPQPGNAIGPSSLHSSAKPSGDSHDQLSSTLSLSVKY